jgi:hypothetical protein
MVRISSETYEYVTQIETELFPEPDPFANFDATDAYNSGTYTEPAYQAPSYSPQYGQRIDDGLGHYSDDGGATWMNYSGGAYQEGNEFDPEFGNFGFPDDAYNRGAQPAEINWPSYGENLDPNDPFANFDAGAAENLGVSYNQPQSSFQPQDEFFGNFDRYAPENMGVTDFPESASRAQFVDYDLGNMNSQFADPGFEAPWNPPWMQEQNDAQDVLSNMNIRQPDPYEPGYVEDSRFDTSGNMLGSPLNAFNDWIADPIAETGAQFTPFLNAAAAPGGFAVGELASRFGLGTAPSKSMGAGLSEFGSAVRDSGGNPFEFAAIQDENFNERPWYQQLGASAVFDPTNLIGVGALQKAGLIDDAAQFASGAMRGIRGVDDAVETVPSIYKSGILPRLGEEAQFPPGLVDVPPGRAMPQFAGAADEGIDPAITEAQRLNQEGISARLREQRQWENEQRLQTQWQKLNALRGDDLDAMVREMPVEDITAQRVREQYLPPGVAKNVFDAFDQRLAGEAVATPPVSAIDQPYSPTYGSVSDDALNEPRRALLDALTEQRRMRESGAIEDIKHQGRIRQANALGEAMDTIKSGGGTFNENLSAMTGSMRGAILPQGRPLNLTDETMVALQKEIIEAVDTRRFDAIAAIKGLDRANQGLYVQPAQMRELRKVFGDEIAEAIAVTNKDRLQTVAELTDGDWARINRQAEVDGKRIATLEVQASRQHELADEITKKARMDPTNVRLKKASEDARARAIAKENEADRLLAERAEKWAGKQAKQAETAAQRAARAANEREVRGGLKADDKTVTKEFTETGQEAIAKAEKLIEKEALSPALAQQAREVVAEQVRRQGVLLNAVGDEAPGLIRQLYASVTGEVTDPWVSQLITQRGFVSGALQASGYSDTTARAIANHLVDAEVKMRYGANPPEWVTSSLKQAAPASRKGAANSVQGFAMITQEMKNLMFSIGDFAILGQQGLKTLATQPVSLSVGIGNRIANKMLAYANLHAIDTNTAMGRLPRNITDIMDGGATIARGAVDVNPEDGTLLRHIPGLKKVDENWTKAAGFISDLQFKTILGTMRDISNEGNLVLLKLTGSDIQNPIVRQRSMKWANAFTSAGTLAQRSERATAERGFVLSASMTRAQVQQLGLLTRVLANKENAVIGVSTALGTIGSMYAIGKVINDRYGVNPFEFDPSKPGFGQVTLKNGTVIDVFPQDQLIRVLTRTARLAAEQPEDMWSEVGKEWAKFGMGRSSPPLQFVEKAAGFGYQPGEGWKFGDYGDGMSKGDRLLNNLPLPPIVGQLKEAGLDPVRTPLQIGGFTTFEESDYNALDRAVKNDPSFGGKSYRELTDPLEKKRAQDLYGKLEPFGAEGERAAEVLKQKTAEQQASDAKLWETDKEEWRKDYSERKSELAITNEEIYHKLDLETKDPILKGFYDAIDAAEGADGKIDWNQVDDYRAGLPPEQSSYIETRTGLVKIDTPATQVFKQDYDKIKGSGFFERSDAAWEATQGSVPGLDGFKDYYEWRDTLRSEIVKEWTAQGLIPEFAAKEADKFLDKQTPAKAMEHYGTMWRDQWMQSDPEAALLAWRYGYWEPNASQAKWLNQVFAGQGQ